MRPVPMRPIDVEDLRRLHRLIREIEVAEGQPMVTPLAEVEELFDDPDTDVVADLRVIERDRTLVGWARVLHHPSGERLERVFCLGGVHPAHRAAGLGRELLGWSLRRAEEKLAETPAHLPGFALVSCYETQLETAQLAARLGFAPVRYNDELQRPLTELPPVPELDGITIRRWDEGDAASTNEGARLVYNAAFADHWGSTPRSVESWASNLATHGTRLDLSFVAVDDETGGIVAYSLNDHWPDDEAVTGRLDGWIGSLGTLREHRKRGIASALVVRSLHRFAEAGLNSAMLGVDTDNPSGAYGIYESLGFAPLRRGVTHQRLLRPASDPLATTAPGN